MTSWSGRLRRGAVVGGCLSAVAGLGALGLASCSLGLDESLIGAGTDAGVDETSLLDNWVPEGDGALPPLSPESGICDKNEDCKGSLGCLVAKCDLPRRACVLEVCRTPVCTSSVCGGGQCAAPTPYSYRAGKFPVGHPIGCGGALGRCFAAVYPFVFVGTPNGVVAFSASDPQSTTPLPVPVVGLGFVPAQILASGSRVYFLGAPQGTMRLPIAYVDVPSDPFAMKISVTTVLSTYDRTADPLALLPRGNDTALLVDLNPAGGYASTPIEPPLVDPSAFASAVNVFAAGASPVAVSGSRLVMARLVPTNSPVFNFIDPPGSGMAGPDVPMTGEAPTAGSQFFSQSADGSIFWAHIALTVGSTAIRAARGNFLVAGPSGPLDAATGIDLEVYGSMLLAKPSVGPVAMLDAKTVMVTTADPANTAAQTNVKFVTREPLAILKRADGVTERISVLPVPVTQVAAAASNGLGYALTVDPAPPNAVSIYVFDPACQPP